MSALSDKALKECAANAYRAIMAEERRRQFANDLQLSLRQDGCDPYNHVGRASCPFRVSGFDVT